MLFPNPASNYVDIDIESLRYREAEVSVVSYDGKVLIKEKVESVPATPIRIDLESVQNGQYFIRVESEGRRAMIKQLIIMR
jgi:hypothetical protein